MSEGVVGNTKVIVEVVLLSTIEFSFAKMGRILQTFLQEGNSTLWLGSQHLLGKLHPAQLILGRHLAFAALPRMELVGIELLHGFLIASQLVEQRNLLQYKVVALGYQLRIVLQEIQTLLTGFLQTLVELVELHQHAGIGIVEAEGALHTFEGLVLTSLFVEVSHTYPQKEFVWDTLILNQKLFLNQGHRSLR